MKSVHDLGAIEYLAVEFFKDTDGHFDYPAVMMSSLMLLIGIYGLGWLMPKFLREGRLIVSFSLIAEKVAIERKTTRVFLVHDFRLLYLHNRILLWWSLRFCHRDDEKLTPTVTEVELRSFFIFFCNAMHPLWVIMQIISTASPAML